MKRWGPRPADRVTGAGRNRCQWAGWLMLGVGIGGAYGGFLALAVVGAVLTGTGLVSDAAFARATATPAQIALCALTALAMGSIYVMRLGDALEARRRRREGITAW